MKVLNSKEMKEIDQKTINEIGIPGTTLMENAGIKVVKAMEKEYNDLFPYKIAIIAGKGNNGGDGFVVARQLHQKNVDVDVYILAKKEDIKGDAKINLNILYNYKDIKIVEIPDKSSFKNQKIDFNNYQIIVDTILGTGIKKPVEGYYGFIIEKINETAATVVSVDIPSGLFSDGYIPVDNCVYSNLTVTFTAPKLGLISPESEEYVGKLYVANIGTPEFLLDRPKYKYNLISPDELQMLFFPRSKRSYKSHFGKICIISGIDKNKNAPILSGLSALRSGCGSVILFSNLDVSHLNPELIFEETSSLKNYEKIIKKTKSGDVVLIGKGVFGSDLNREFLKQYLSTSEVATILNSDGTKLLEEKYLLNRKCENLVIMTSPSELAKILKTSSADVEENREKIGIEFSKKYNVTLILKGYKEVIYFPDGEIYINPTGNPGMATEGNGDVLAGIIAAFVARINQQNEYAWKLAICSGVYLHGLSGDIASQKKEEEGLISTDIIEYIPEAIKKIKYEDLEDDIFI